MKLEYTEFEKKKLGTYEFIATYVPKYLSKEQIRKVFAEKRKEILKKSGD